MGYLSTSDHDPDDAAAHDAQAEDAYRDGLLCDYLAAREALKRITVRTPQAEAFAIQDRFHRAQHAINQQAMRGLQGAA
jgi:hypothetical protein